METTRVYDALIQPGPGMTELYPTESHVPVSNPFQRPSIENRVDTAPLRGSGLVKIASGRGQIIIDQLRWEAAYENSQRLSEGRSHLRRVETLRAAPLYKFKRSLGGPR